MTVRGAPSISPHNEATDTEPKAGERQDRAPAASRDALQRVCYDASKGFRMGSDIERRDQGGRPATQLPAVDFSSVLARTIASIREDPAQLRNAIYELARVKLQKEAWAKTPSLNILETRRLMLALETAIERVETLYSQQDELHKLQSPRPVAEPDADLRSPAADERDHVIVIDHAPILGREAEHAPAFLATAGRPRWRPARRRRSPVAAPLLRAGVVAILVVALVVILEKKFALLGKIPSAITAMAPNTPDMKTAPEPKPVPQARPPATQSAVPAFPLPSVYGVYAAGNGQLYELEALPGRVPDQKVFMSTAIKTPSRTMLPDGRIAFIVYRRDIATSAPDRVQVRVIARIMRAMSFNTAGQANTASLDDQWTIRGNSYDLRVAPVSESAEMLMIRPEDSDFVFPSGRYGLVLKGQAYDFTVAGAITEGAQCLERIEAANGSFYSECRKP